MIETKKILVCEDELSSSILMKRVLTKAGYEVTLSDNGQDAIKKLEIENFDVLLTDWMMPHLDGIELIRRVREKISPLPIIILFTALVSEGARNYVLDSGADDYISKPIIIPELLTIIKNQLLNKHIQNSRI